jgi:hypothetical protein
MRKRRVPEHLSLRRMGERRRALDEQWEHVKALFEERLEYHRRRKEEEEQAAQGGG